MFKFKFTVVPILVVLAVSPAWGQLSQLTTAFTNQAVKINFDNQKEGTVATDLYSAWGVVFLGNGPTVPTIRARLFVNLPNNAVRNEAPVGSSGTQPLIINFRFPVKRVGFLTSNGDANTVVSIKAFDPMGNQLGLVQPVGIAQETFLGVETPAASGIAKLTIDYGNIANAEQIDDLTMEFVSRPQFNLVLGQFAEGGLAGGGALRTALVVSNLTNSTAKGSLKLFDSSGSGQSFNLQFSPGVSVAAGNTFDFTLPAFSSKSFTTTETPVPAKAGYARLEANVPIEGSALFQVVDANQKLVSEAGVSVSTPKPQAVGAVRKFTFDDLSSGFAAVNTSTVQADATISLFDEFGLKVAFDDTILDLGPGQHIARFIDVIFPLVATGDFRGTVLIESDQPLAIVILRTKGGVPISSLPVGSTQK